MRCAKHVLGAVAARVLLAARSSLGRYYSASRWQGTQVLLRPPSANTKGYSSTDLAMGFANVRAGTQAQLKDNLS